MHIALVFDDGPTAQNASKLLAIFDRLRLRVTFAVIARNVQSYPHVAKAVVAAGHELVNHSCSHQHPKDLDDAGLVHEVIEAQRIITDVTGFSPRWYWPPFGEYDPRLPAVASEAGIGIYVPRKLIVSQDYLRDVDADAIRANATTGVCDGAVILFHEWRDETVAQMPAIISDLKGQGCAFLTFSELAADLLR